METKIRYRNLSGWLKFAAISAWTLGIGFGIVFLMGFIDGFFGSW